MFETIFYSLKIAGAIGSGVMAGIFFIFSNTVMSALAGIATKSGISAMQAINRVIQNPLFFLFFFGTGLISLVLAISVAWRWQQPGTAYSLIGGLLYLVGCLLVTVVFNVPRNDALDALESESGEAADYWKKYLKEWTFWNHIRTVACLISALCFILAIR